MRYVLAVILIAGLLVGCDGSTTTQAMLPVASTTVSAANPTSEPAPKPDPTPDPIATPTSEPTAIPTPDPTPIPTYGPPRPLPFRVLTGSPSLTAIPSLTARPTSEPEPSDARTFTSDPSSTSKSPIALKPAGAELAKLSSVVPVLGDKPEKGDRLARFCYIKGGGRETVHVVAIFALIPEGSQIGARWFRADKVVETSYTDPQPQQANAHLIFSGHNIWRGSWRVDIVDGSSVLASVDFMLDGYGGPWHFNAFWTHIVKDGDTLASIVRAKWEPGNQWYSLWPPTVKDVMTFNELQSENHIYVGQVLRIPYSRHGLPCEASALPVPSFL